GLAGLAPRACEVGVEPLVEAHDEPELEVALATDTRLIGINNRDLRTLAVDTGPGDRPRTAATPRRAAGAPGRPPHAPANRARRPFVKICGVTDVPGVHAAVRAGADAIGLNIVAGTPRALRTDEAADLAAAARAVGRPRIVLITANASDELLDETVLAVDPDAIQYTGTEPRSRIVGGARRGWRTIHVSPGGSTDDAVATGRDLLAAGAERLLIDTAGGPHPGG